MKEDLREFGGMLPAMTNRNRRAEAVHTSVAPDPSWGSDAESAATSATTLPLARVAGWVLAVVRKLESLAKLPVGWDSYGGLTLRPGARRATVETIHSLDRLDLPVPGVVLGSDGTVGLEWRRRGKELDLDIGEGSRIEYVLSHPNGTVNEGQADRDDRQRLLDLARWLLDASAP